MRSYLRVEDYPKNLPRISPGSYSKSKFAKLMSCSEKLLDNLESLTSSIKIDNKIKNRSLVGNIACRYCVQRFKNESIWVGCYFERLVGFKLQVSFFVKIPTGKGNLKSDYAKGIMESHYNFTADYSVADDAYYFNILIDNPLRTCCDVDLAKNQIQSIIDEILQKKC